MGLASITNNIITDTSIPSANVITGTLASGQVAYGSAANTIAGSNNLFWNNTTNRLGINTPTPTSALQVVGTIRATNIGSPLLFGEGSDDLSLGTQGGTVGFTIKATTRNLMLYSGGLPADGGQRFQVYGDTLLNGLTTLRGTTNNDTTTIFRIEQANQNGRFLVNATGQVQIVGDPYALSENFLSLTRNSFNPTSGSTTHTSLFISPTINQTGTATGITRGVLVSPTFTVAPADWRSIEWSNNAATAPAVSWGLYGAGTAPNYMAGSLGIGNTSFAGMNLRVSKSITGSATGRSVYLSGDFQSDVSVGYGVQTSFGTQAATFTLSDLIYFQAAQGTKGGGSTIGTQVGFDVASMTNGSTNIAFRGQNASASNVWNLYMNGTAINYLNGALLIGSATNDTINKLQVTGTAVAGSKTSTEGSVILRGSYTSGYLTTFGTDASSGGPMLSYAVESAQNSTEASFVSSTPNVTTPRSAYTVSSNHRWYTAPASTTAVGTAISLTKHMELFNSGNLVLGGAAEVAGSKLQVIGNALVKGSTNDATAVALTVQNSDGTNLFRVQNDNSIFLHGTTYIGTSTTRARIYAGGDFSESAHMTSPNNRQVLRIVSGIIANNISDNSSVFEVNQNITSNATVNNVSNTLISGTYTAATGSVNFNGLLIANTINQSGTANGIIRGLYVNPSFTTVTQNWRSIEWSNNTGWGIYGTGVAPNQMNGRLTVSATIPQTGTNGFATFANNRIGLFGAQTIDVPTTAAFNQGTVTAAGTSAQYLTFNGNTTVGGDALLAGSVHINSVQFATTGTVTMNNSAAGGQRTMSVMQLQMQKAGIVGGTINRGSTLYLFGVYPTTSTGGTVTFTEYAGLRIGNLMEWLDGTPPNTTVALTNKWGIYQEGPGDPNYFAGAVGVGITTPHPTAKLQVDSLTQGFLPPRMSLAERDAIVNPAEGLIVYVTDAAVNKHFGYNGISWNAFY